MEITFHAFARDQQLFHRNIDPNSYYLQLRLNALSTWSIIEIKFDPAVMVAFGQPCYHSKIAAKIPESLFISNETVYFVHFDILGFPFRPLADWAGPPAHDTSCTEYIPKRPFGRNTQPANDE